VQLTSQSIWLEYLLSPFSLWWLFGFDIKLCFLCFAFVFFFLFVCFCLVFIFLFCKGWRRRMYPSFTSILLVCVFLLGNWDGVAESSQWKWLLFPVTLLLQCMFSSFCLKVYISCVFFDVANLLKSKFSVCWPL